MPPTSQAPGTATLILRLRRYARPRPRCTVRLCTDFAPATMATASLTPSSLRHTARRGRLTLKPQADFRDSLSLRKLCDTPLCCLLQVRFTPSPSFNSATRRIVITAHRHVKHLVLIASAPRKSGGCRERGNPQAEFPRTRQRFYRAMGWLSAYSARARRARGKTSVSAVGGA